MKLRIWILLLLGGLILVWGCGGSGEIEQVTRPEQMAGYAFDYVDEGVEWINRDGWASVDGTAKHYFSVSYNLFRTDSCHAFVDKIISSTPGEDQQYWSQYTSFHPGGRSTDDSLAYDWAGTYCQGLVYWSAIKAGYPISSSYLGCLNCWENLGTQVITPQEGDLILMDFDTTNNHPGITYEHLGVMWGMLPMVLSAVAIYGDPFKYRAGTHTIQDYKNVLPVEFEGIPPGHPGYDIFNELYIRLPE